MNIIEIEISKLSRHPVNQEIYGDVCDSQLSDSVKKIGILTPILITETNVVISGHRRVEAAKLNKIKFIEARVFDSDNELDILEALIITNEQRSRTTEQKAREFIQLQKIEGERAKLRQGARTDIPENFPECKVGDSRDIAAKKIGMSGKNAEKAAEVVKVIDSLKTTGDEDGAERLQAKLNKSVNGAHNQVKPVIEDKKIKEQAAKDHMFEEISPGIWICNIKKQNYKPSFNSTNDSIEWAKWTWNPVTGCLHPCKYCYARAMAENSYYAKAFRKGFKPVFYPSRLQAPTNASIPVGRGAEVGIKNVFVCSMADLFGEWVPSEWIQAVIDECSKAPQWNFLFLTKNPKRYVDIKWPNNAWVGATVDCQNRVDSTVLAFKEMRESDHGPSITFISCEPMSEKINFGAGLSYIDWVIIGAFKGTDCKSCGYAGKGKQPKWEWVEHLFDQARVNGCKVYFKPNLSVVPKEFPVG